MNMEVLTLLLPVLWAIISTIIGLLLYRSSKAVFESTKLSEKGQRRLRLTGSIVIVALAFYGMKTAIPTNRLGGLPDGAVVIQPSTYQHVLTSIERADRISLELAGAVEVNDSATIRERTRNLREEIRGLRDSLAQASKN